MKIPEWIKTCVAFVGYQMSDKTYKMAWTVYFISRDDNWTDLKYAVTAKHVIEWIRWTGLEDVYLRINIYNEGAYWLKTKLSDWIYHSDENVDIATLGLGFSEKVNQKFYPLSGSVTNEIREKQQIEEGDEVFITGLFKHHHGNNKNIPIIRVGNISAMPDEKIQTKHHLMDWYLIEARSIGGLSGSPVFVNLWLHRYIDWWLKQSSSSTIYYLLGMIYGHFDTNILEDEAEEDWENSTNRINMGIAIVTPVNKLIEHLDQIAKINWETTK